MGFQYPQPIRMFTSSRLFPYGQVNFPLDYIPLYQDKKLHLDTTIPINSFFPSKKREGGEV
jgi:hypothetical protein